MKQATENSEKELNMKVKFISLSFQRNFIELFLEILAPPQATLLPRPLLRLSFLKCLTPSNRSCSLY